MTVSKYFCATEVVVVVVVVIVVVGFVVVVVVVVGGGVSGSQKLFSTALRSWTRANYL